MNQRYPQILSTQGSGLSCLLTFLMVGLLLGSIGLGWLVNAFFILLGLVFITPILVWVGFRWWINRNLVSSACPVCNYEFTAINGNECQCPNCGETLNVMSGAFERVTPPGTIDIEAIDVSITSAEE